MLSSGVIEPSISPYSSPPLIIESQNKKPRFCVDFRQLNEITESVYTTLPKINDTLKDLGTATIFSTIDLKSGYWQISLTDQAKPLTHSQPLTALIINLLSWRLV